AIAGGAPAAPTRRRESSPAGRRPPFPKPACEIHTLNAMSNPGPDQASRLREALLDLCAERGYANLELQDLLERAGVERATFDREYSDLDACFAAVLGQVYAEFFSRAQAAVEGQIGWRDRMRATAYALLRFLR